TRRLAWISLGLAVIVALALYTIGQAVVLVGAFQRLRGEPLRAGTARRTALARALPLMVLAALWSLPIGVCLVVAFSVVPLVVFQAGTGMLLAYALMPIPLVPAAVAFVVWVVAVPACAIEGLGPIASMFRSFDLTKGHRWKVFGIALLAGALFLAGSSLIDLILDDEGLANFAHGAWVTVFMAGWNTIIIAMYHDLRAA